MNRVFTFLAKDKTRAHQVIVATLPVFIYLSYSLYSRLVWNSPNLTPRSVVGTSSDFGLGNGSSTLRQTKNSDSGGK